MTLHVGHVQISGKLAWLIKTVCIYIPPNHLVFDVVFSEIQLSLFSSHRLELLEASIKYLVGSGRGCDLSPSLTGSQEYTNQIPYTLPLFNLDRPFLVKRNHGPRE